MVVAGRVHGLYEVVGLELGERAFTALLDELDAFGPVRRRSDGSLEILTANGPTRITERKGAGFKPTAKGAARAAGQREPSGSGCASARPRQLQLPHVPVHIERGAHGRAAFPAPPPPPSERP
jgi:hypothetical protein